MAKTYSCLLVGVDVHQIEIETVMGSGFSGLNILGLASDATRDMRERVRSALESIGIPIPARRVVVNIGPSDVIKLSRTGLCQLDFAVAACVIRALFEDTKEMKHFHTPEQEFLSGELSLSGELKSISNPLIYEAILSAEEDKKEISICLPCGNKKENMSDSFEYFENLKQWFEQRKNKSSQKKQQEYQDQEKNVHIDKESSREFLKNQIQNACESVQTLLKNPHACVALLVAAAGGHHMLIAGEPGIGKSFSLKKMPHFLLPLSKREQIEVKLIHLEAEEEHRPFRAPHHSSTSAALVGGSSLRPGEVTLAHRGILFLDELAEFSRSTLEALREPLDSGNVTLSRTRGSVSYPAQFQLVATANPCPCGYLFSRSKPCRCNPNESRKYLQKISGPILDRFCLQIWLNPAKEKEEFDIFSQHLLEISSSPSDLAKFIAHFFEVQDQRRQGKRPDLAANNLSTENHLSMRGQDKIYQIFKTFSALFPQLAQHELFPEHIMGYRVLSEMFGKKGYF